MLETYVIHVTKECNMNCFYCYEKDKTSRYSKEEVLDLVDKIAQNCKDEQFVLEFLGGEPLMAFENIKSVYEYMQTNYPGRVNAYYITTNGSVLTDEIKEFLLNSPNVIYAVSEDGVRWANQFRRFHNGDNAYDVVMKNIEWATENIPERMNVHMVTHPYNVAYLADGVKLLYEKGVRSIGVGTVESTMEIDAAYCDRFIKELLDVSKLIVSGKLSGLRIDLFDHIKPKSDVRTYIHDPKTGKVVGESYGRSADDITHTDEYDSVQTGSPLQDVIYNLRRCVYENHQAVMMQGE